MYHHWIHLSPLYQGVETSDLGWGPLLRGLGLGPGFNCSRGSPKHESDLEVASFILSEGKGRVEQRLNSFERLWVQVVYPLRVQKPPRMNQPVAQV